MMSDCNCMGSSVTSIIVDVQHAALKGFAVEGIQSYFSRFLPVVGKGDLETQMMSSESKQIFLQMQLKHVLTWMSFVLLRSVLHEGRELISY